MPSKMKWFHLALTFVAIACFFQVCNGQTKRKGSQLTLNDKVQQLTEMSHKRSVLRFNMRHFQDYVSSSPRNYSVIVMFTALASHRQCAICRYAHDEFVIVANSYRYANMHSSQLFFVLVDFDEGPEVFNQMRLNTAPVFIHFPPKGKPKVSDTLDIQRVGFSAEAIAKWISERTDVQIRLFRPPNYMGTVAVVVLFMLIGVFFYIRRSNLDFLYNKTAWAAIATVFCFTMVSGQMWNHIRGPPFIHKSASGGVAYIHGSSQGQFVLETYIVFILIAAITLGMIMMIEAATQKGDVKKRRTCGIIGVVLVLIFYSLILSIFRSKAHGYPYSFLIK